MDELAALAFGQNGLSPQERRLPLSVEPAPLPEDDTSLSARLSAAGKPKNVFQTAAARQVQVLDGLRVLDTTSFPATPPEPVGRFPGSPAVDATSVQSLAESLLRLSFDALYNNVRPAGRRAVRQDFEPKKAAATDVMRSFLNPLAYIVRAAGSFTPYVAPRPGQRPDANQFEYLITDIFGQAFVDTASQNDRLGMFLFTLLALRHELRLQLLPLRGEIDLLWLGVLLGPEKTGPEWRGAVAALNSNLADALPLKLPEWGFYWPTTATIPAETADRLRAAALRLGTVPRFVFDVVAASVDLSLLPLTSTPLVGDRFTVQLAPTGMRMKWYAVLTDVSTAREAAGRKLLPGALDLDASAAWNGYVFDLGSETPDFQTPPFPFVLFGLGRRPQDRENKYTVTRVVQVYPMARCTRCHSNKLLLAGIEETREQCIWEVPVILPHNPLDDVREAHYTLVWHWNQVQTLLGVAVEPYSVAQQAEAAVRLWENATTRDSANPLVRALADVPTEELLLTVDPLLRSTFENIARELWYIAQERERVGRPARHEDEIQYARGLLMARERMRTRYSAQEPSHVRYIGHHNIQTPNPDFLLLENDLDNDLIIVANTSRASIVSSDGATQLAMTEILRQVNEYQARALPGLRQRTAPVDGDDLYDPYSAAARGDALRSELLGHYVKVKGFAERFNALLAAPNPYLAPLPDFDTAFTNELEALRA